MTYNFFEVSMFQCNCLEEWSTTKKSKSRSRPQARFFHLIWKNIYRLTKHKSKGKAYEKIAFKCEGRAIKIQRVKFKIKACGRLMFETEIKACKG